MTNTESRDLKNKYLNNGDIHKIANDAAQNFLNSIMKY